MHRIKFMNTHIDNVTMEETLEELDRLIRKKTPAYVVTPNVDHIVQLEKDEELKRVYENADMILTDGKPLLWIAKFYKTPIKEKISGSDLFPRLCEKASQKGYTIFFLGAAEGVAAEAARKLIEKYPGLRIAGTYSPSYGFEKRQEDMEQIKKMIRDKEPDILIVGLGCPKQEKFIYKYYKELRVPLSLGLGASFDFEAGNVKRAPVWMSRHGFEWLFRITQDPRRMFKRYVIDDRKIVGLIWKYRNG